MPCTGWFDVLDGLYFLRRVSIKVALFVKVSDDFYDSECYLLSVVVPYCKYRVLIDDMARTITEVCK
jgi:hypothetical protein